MIARIMISQKQKLKKVGGFHNNDVILYVSEILILSFSCVSLLGWYPYLSRFVIYLGNT